MLSRITIPVLAAAVLVFACGPRKPSSIASSSSNGTTNASVASTKTGKAAGNAAGDVKTPGRNAAKGAGKGVVSHVMVDTTEGAVRFAIEVANDTKKRVEIDFPSGRTYDFAVLDASGREVWRWSEGRMFTQGMQNRLLDANGSVVYSERWSPSGPGRYTLVAQLHSENYPVTQRVEFSLPGAFASR